MKKIAIAAMAVLMIAAMALTAGCGNTTAADDAGSNVSDTTVVSQQAAAVTGFKPGVWKNDTVMYVFDADGKGGRNETLADGMGVGFEYELAEDGTCVFHMGSADDNTKATVAFADEDNATITWESGDAIELQFVCEAGPTSFKAGTWENETIAYTFEADGKSGSNEAKADGMGVGFEYELAEDGTCVFHMGSADDNTKATVKFADENNVTITWESGDAVTLAFVG